ncbi:Fur family transcriptional regulator [Solirubrobacter soli]|uniref:Fur family transcriptional regulator n=1 Tax=Solirubrobacter soli TaxID=363832 RepID=UPI0004024797|nr:Fur family transcriptional regulator [Solirubrobacter soli]
MTTEELDQELTAALRERGQRVTLPRLLVHRHVRSADRHLTADQVYEELAREHPGLSPATVYSTLDLLEQLGAVRRVSTPRGATTYDSRTDQHHHLICSRCGRVEDLDVALDTGAAEAAGRAAGFRVGHAQLTLTGLCRDCLEEAEAH